MSVMTPVTVGVTPFAIVAVDPLTLYDQPNDPLTL
jgi:hypothetical protein